MRVEVVHYQMNGAGIRVTRGDALEHACELGNGAIFGGVGIVPTALGLDDAEHVGSSAPRVFIVGRAARPGAIGVPSRTESSSCTGRSSSR